MNKLAVAVTGVALVGVALLGCDIGKKKEAEKYYEESCTLFKARKIKAADAMVEKAIASYPEFKESDKYKFHVDASEDYKKAFQEDVSDATKALQEKRVFDALINYRLALLKCTDCDPSITDKKAALEKTLGPAIVKMVTNARESAARADALHQKLLGSQCGDGDEMIQWDQVPALKLERVKSKTFYALAMRAIGIEEYKTAGEFEAADRQLAGLNWWTQKDSDYVTGRFETNPADVDIFVTKDLEIKVKARQ